MDELLRKLNSLRQFEVTSNRNGWMGDEIRECKNGEWVSLDEIAQVFGVQRHWDGTFIVDENTEQLKHEDSLR